MKEAAKVQIFSSDCYSDGSRLMKAAGLSELITHVDRGHILFQYQKTQMLSVSDQMT